MAGSRKPPTRPTPDPLLALGEAIRNDPLPLDAYSLPPEQQAELSRLRQLEAERLERQLAHIPWYRDSAASLARSGVSLWRRLAASWNPGHLPL